MRKTLIDLGQMVNDDAGRSQFQPNEQLDCTVRAFALLEGIPYNQAHDILRNAGREYGQCFACVPLYNSFFESVPLWECSPAGNAYANRFTVNQFLKCNPKGKFLVSIPGHVFTVIDGIIHDTGRGLFRFKGIKRIWKEKA